MLKTFRPLLVITALFLLTFSGYGQAGFHYRSKQSGSWGTFTTWESSPDGKTYDPTNVIPSSTSNTITISSSHSVVAGSNYTVDQLVVDSTATLTVEIGLTIANGEGDDLQVFGTLIADGPLSMSGNAVIKNGGLYVLNIAKSSTLPPRYITWEVGSTVKLIAASTNIPITNINQHFYNFIWDGSAQTASYIHLNLNNSFQVNGKMHILSTNTERLTLTSSSDPVTLNINDDLEISNLAVVILSYNTGPVTLNVGSNLIIGGNVGETSLAIGDATKLSNKLNIRGNISIGGTAGGINNHAKFLNGTICFTNTGNTQTISNLGTIQKLNYIINPSVAVSSPTFNVHAGYSLTIKDNASLITNSNVIATVERQVSNADWNVPLDGWHLLSSPVDNQMLTNGGFLTGEYDFYAWSEPLNTWLNQKVTGNNITKFDNGKGYFVAYDNGGLKTFQGPLNVSSQVFNNLSQTETSEYSSFHLLGNPFMSAIDWSHSAWNRQQVGEVVIVWNEIAMNYLALSSINPIIPSCQGFFVHVLSSANSITIPTEARIHSSAPIYKEGVANVLHLRVTGENQPMYDETIIRLHDDASGGFDKYDGYEMAGSDLAPQIYTEIQSNENAQGNKLAVNTLPVINEVSSLPLIFRPGIDDTYRLKVLIGTMNDEVWLEDKFSGIISRLESDSSYTFQSLPTDDINRFILHFGALPGKSPNVEIVNIYAVGKSVFIREISDTNGEVLDYKVISTSGQTLAEGSGKGAMKIDLPHLPTGMYIVIVTNNTRSVHTGKIIL